MRRLFGRPDRSVWAMMLLTAALLAAAPTRALAQPPTVSSGPLVARPTISVPTAYGPIPIFDRATGERLQSDNWTIQNAVGQCDRTAYDRARQDMLNAMAALQAAMDSEARNAARDPAAADSAAVHILRQRRQFDIDAIKKLLDGLPAYPNPCAPRAAAPPPAPLAPPTEGPPQEPPPIPPPAETPTAEPVDGDSVTEPEPEDFPEPPGVVVNGGLSKGAQVLAKCASAGESEKISQLLKSIRLDQGRIFELEGPANAAAFAVTSQQVHMRSSAAAYVGHPELFRVDDDILLQLQQKSAEARDAANAAEAPYKKAIQDATNEIEAILNGIKARGCPPPAAGANGQGHASAPAGPSILHSVLGGAVSIGIGVGEERLAAPIDRRRDDRAAPVAHAPAPPPTHDTPPPTD